MRLFVIGGEGQVARSLREAASRSDNIVFGFGARPDLDLLRPASIAKALADFRPDLIVNPAAYTMVDKAESEPDLAFALNRDGARAVAAAAADRDVPVIHLSKPTPWGRKAFMAGPSLRANWPLQRQIPGISYLERRGSTPRSAATSCAPCCG
jgi:dTDP-4-dehydrorhamnose reductase